MRFNLTPFENVEHSSVKDEVVQRVNANGGHVLGVRRNTVIIECDPSLVSLIMQSIDGWEIEVSQRSSSSTAMDGTLHHRHPK